MGKLKLEGCQRAPTAVAEMPPLTCRKDNPKVFDIKLGLNSAQEQFDDGDINKRRPKIRSRQVSVGSPENRLRNAQVHVAIALQGCRTNRGAG